MLDTGYIEKTNKVLFRLREQFWQYSPLGERPMQLDESIAEELIDSGVAIVYKVPHL